MKKELRIYWVFLAAGLLLYFYSLWGRIPDIDGAWIGENAYWIAKIGYAKSELMRGITSQGTLNIIHHKLFNLLGGLWIKMFGFSVYTLKSISLLFFLALSVLLLQYSAKEELTFSKSDKVLLFTLLLYFPWVFKYSYVYRPEIMITTLGFAAFILLENNIQAKNNKVYAVWFAGILMGLAIATHLNGLVLAASGFVLLALNQQFKKLIPYSIGTLIGLSIYFYDFYQPGYFSFWYYQFFNSPAVQQMHEYPLWIEPLLNLLNEHLRYFHNLKIIVFTLFMIFTLASGYKYLYKNHRIITQFALLMFIFTGILTIHDTRKYIILNLPYILLLLVITLNALHKGKITTFKLGVSSKTIYKISYILMTIYLLVSFGFNVEYSLDKFSATQNRDITLKYAGKDVKKLNVVAPLTFIFNEIEYYNSIQGELCYLEFQKTEPDLKGLKFLNKTEQYGNELLIISPFYQKKFGISNYEQGKRYGNFDVVEKNDKYIILKKASPVKLPMRLISN